MRNTTVAALCFWEGLYRLRCTSLEDIILLNAEIRQWSPRSTQNLPATIEEFASKATVQ